MKSSSFFRHGVPAFTLACAAGIASAASTMPTAGADAATNDFYQQRNLVSDGSVPADHTDPVIGVSTAMGTIATAKLTRLTMSGEMRREPSPPKKSETP